MRLHHFIGPIVIIILFSFNLGRISCDESQVETYKKVGYTEVMIACLDMTKDDQVLCASITNRVRELKE